MAWKSDTMPLFHRPFRRSVPPTRISIFRSSSSTSPGDPNHFSLASGTVSAFQTRSTGAA